MFFGELINCFAFFVFVVFLDDLCFVFGAQTRDDGVARFFC